MLIADYGKYYFCRRILGENQFLNGKKCEKMICGLMDKTEWISQNSLRFGILKIRYFLGFRRLNVFWIRMFSARMLWYTLK
jgi:hypothetical protein